MTVPLTPAERAAIDELKSLTRLTDDADLLRLAIWHLAKHCGRDVGDLFELQLGRRHATQTRKPDPSAAPSAD